MGSWPVHGGQATREGRWVPARVPRLNPHCLPPVAWQLGVKLKFNSALKVKPNWFHLAQKTVELHF